MIKLFILIFILSVGNLSAAYMKITLKNNTFDIYSDCSKPSKEYSNDYECKREYVIKLQSKYNVFEHYCGRNYFKAKIVTNLYTIRPIVYNPNKSEFNLRLSEAELKQLLESKEMKIIFDLSLFSDKLLRRELKNINQYSYDINILEPTVILDTSNLSIGSLRNECNQENRICTKKLDKLNSPTNRLKRFFNF